MASAHVSYDVARGDSGIVEQDPEAWWQAARVAVKQAVGIVGSNVEVVAVGVSSTNALIALGADGIALRPAIMQLDRRAQPDALRLAQELGADQVLRRTGSPLAAGASWLPTLRWLQCGRILDRQGRCLLRLSRWPGCAPADRRTRRGRLARLHHTVVRPGQSGMVSRPGARGWRAP